MKGKA